MNQPNKKGKQKLKPESSDPVEVYCRIRPRPEGTESCVKRVHDNIIHLFPPSSSLKNGTVKEMQYTFKYAFDEMAEQNEVFEHVGVPLVRDLINRKNGLLFTYGITSSGKTFTVLGTSDTPGILPRTLDTLFNSINKFQAQRCVFKSDKMNGFDIQTEAEARLDCQQREVILEKGNRIRRRVQEPETDFTNRRREERTIEELDEDCSYAVFVSYVEIYNNYVYDLLQSDVSGDTGAKLQSRMLRSDANGRVYVEGATELEVRSADDALQLIGRGQKARRIASTQLNADSSRSHAIFNIRLVQAPLDDSGERIIQDKDVVTISQLSLVDLAGSERAKRTNNDGDRLREAGNINSSLLALRKCLDVLRGNQSGEQTEMVPFRESKLTRLFENYFAGDGKVRMIVCINPSAVEYDETIHVLRFAETAQEVQVSRSQQVRFEQLGLATGRRAAAAIATEENRKRKVEEELEQAQTLRRSKKKSSLLPDMEINMSFPPFMLSSSTDSATLPALAEFLEDRIRRHKAMYASLKDQELAFIDRLRGLLLNNHELRRENDVLRTNLDDQERVIADLERQLEDQAKLTNLLLRHSTLNEQEKQNLLDKLQDRDYAMTEEQKKRQKFQTKIKAQARDASAKTGREFERRLKDTTSGLAAQMNAQETMIKRVRNVLNEDAMDNVSPSAPFHGSSTSTWSAREWERSQSRTPHAAAGGVRDQSQPFHNPRYGLAGRRTNGKSSDKTVEHISKNRVPVGTRLQPHYGGGGIMKRKKSVNKLDLDATKSASKYLLEHQEADSHGGIKTRLFKGDIIPTSGGGRAVIFKDVETLQQNDPVTAVERSHFRASGNDEPPLPREEIMERCATGTAHFSPIKSPSKREQ